MGAENGAQGPEPAPVDGELWDCSELSLADLRVSRNPTLLAVMDRLRRRVAAVESGEGAYSGFTSAL